MIDRQKVFNKVYRALARQGFERSVATDTVTCQYRDPKGRRCAVGHLMLNRYYRSWIEGANIFGDAQQAVVEKSLKLPSQYLSKEGRKNGDLDFLYALQKCHDGSDAPDEMDVALRQFAECNKLDVPKRVRVGRL
jgi:hypothetical protein